MDKLVSNDSVFTARLAHDHLVNCAEGEQLFLELLSFNGLREIPRLGSETFAERISRAVAGQQLSIKAANTIWSRVKSLQSSVDLNFNKFITASSDLELRECGLSFAKIRTIRGLVTGADEGRLNTKSLRKMEHGVLMERLTRFWGIGLWTAEMMAIFYFHSPDVWSKGDVGLRNALVSLYSNDEKRASLVENAAPYRSFLSLHLWAGVDDGFFLKTKVDE